MRSTGFGSIVSPLGSPALNRARTAPSRAPSGGLSALGPKLPAEKPIPMSKVTGSLPMLHHPKLNTMSGVSGRGMPNIKLASFGAKKKSGGVALPKLTPKVPTGKTQGYKKGGDVDGLTQLVRKARANGALPRRFDDGGSVPSYDEYLASGAAPKGLSPDEYQQDYDNYVSDLHRSELPAKYTPSGAVMEATGSKGDASLFNGHFTPTQIADWKDDNTRTLGAPVAAAAPFILPGVGTGMMLADLGTAIGHGTGLMSPESEIPGFDAYLKTMVGDDPRASKAARYTDGLLMAAQLPGLGGGVYHASKWLYKNAGPKLRAFLMQSAARARDAKINAKGSLPARNVAGSVVP